MSGRKWLRLLWALELIVGGPAVLAGGAIRDLLLDREVKDLDVFVQAPTEGAEAAQAKAHQVAAALTMPLGLVLHGDEYMAWANGTLVAIAELKPLVSAGPFAGLPTLNLIFTREVPTVQAMADRIDFGICQVALTVREAYQTAAFDKDVADGTFTFLKEPDQWPRSNRRWKRLQEKYPTYRPVGEPALIGGFDL